MPCAWSIRKRPGRKRRILDFRFWVLDWEERRRDARIGRADGMELSVGVAKREAVGAFRQGVPAPFEVAAWEMGRAIRHTIGWFDYDTLNDFQGEIEGFGEGVEAGASAPLSEAA